MNLPLDPPLHWLLRTAIEGSLLIGLVCALRWAFPRQLSPAWRIALWSVVGLKLLVPAVLPIGLGVGTLFSKPEVAAPPLVAVEFESPTSPTSPTAMPAAPAMAAAPARVSLSHLLTCAWAGGFVLAVACLLIREARFRRALAAQRECDDRELLALVRECAAQCEVAAPRVLSMPDGCGPAIAGLWQPVLLFPADWRARFDRDALRHVLFHELEHVRGRDLVWNWLAALIAAVHWFNPLAWLAASRFQADRELRCDARALARMAPDERFAYGRTLLRIQESFLTPPAIAGLAPCVRNHPSLHHRILMITRPPTTRPWLQALSAGALGIIVCLSFGAAQAQEEPGKDRTREGARSPEGGEKKPAAREGEITRAREGERPRMRGERERDGERPKSGAREGDRPRAAEGEKMRDGERPRSGERDGDRPRTGERDGDRPRTGEREGDRPRDGEGERARGPAIEIRVLGSGDDVKIGERTIAVKQLRGALNEMLRETPGRPVVIDADASTPYAAVAGVLDAARDSGAKNAQIRPASAR